MLHIKQYNIVNIVNKISDRCDIKMVLLNLTHDIHQYLQDWIYVISSALILLVLLVNAYVKCGWTHIYLSLSMVQGSLVCTRDCHI